MRSITWNLIVLSAVITVRAGTGFAAQSKPNVRVCVDIRQKDVNDTVPKKKKPVASCS
jgi:hypothetical protein